MRELLNFIPKYFYQLFDFVLQMSWTHQALISKLSVGPLVPPDTQSKSLPPSSPLSCCCWHYVSCRAAQWPPLVAGIGPMGKKQILALMGVPTFLKATCVGHQAWMVSPVYVSHFLESFCFLIIQAKVSPWKPSLYSLISNTSQPPHQKPVCQIQLYVLDMHAD